MVKIRLARKGAKGKPFYQIVAIDEKKKMTGSPLEVLGYYQPSTEMLKIDKEKVEKWVKTGAVVTLAVKKLMEEKKK